jgi:hypothetical protein
LPQTTDTQNCGKNWKNIQKTIIHRRPKMDERIRKIEKEMKTLEKEDKKRDKFVDAGKKALKKKRK